MEHPAFASLSADSNSLGKDFSLKDAVLGIDISKRTFDAALVMGDKTRTKVLKNDEQGFQTLSKWLGEYGAENVSVCLESTGTYGEALAEYLHGQGHTVYVVNPARIYSYAKSKQLRAKNDKLDAQIIAEYCRVHDDLRAFEPLTPEIKHLQQLDRRIADLKDTLVQEKNRLESADHPELIRSSILRSISFIEAEIAALESEIDDTIGKIPELSKNRELLESPKGLGPVTSRLFIIDFGSFKSFESARAAAAFSGLTPFTRKSGSSLNNPGSISRMGNNRIRQVLFMAAQASARYNPVFKALYDKLRASGKAHKVALCAIARRIVHVAYGMIKHQKPFDETLFVAA
jgi:transposase